MSLALAAGCASCWLGSSTATSLGAPSASLALVSLYATAFASLAPLLQRNGNRHQSQSSPFEGWSVVPTLDFIKCVHAHWTEIMQTFVSWIRIVHMCHVLLTTARDRRVLTGSAFDATPPQA